MPCVFFFCFQIDFLNTLMNKIANIMLYIEDFNTAFHFYYLKIEIVDNKKYNLQIKTFLYLALKPLRQGKKLTSYKFYTFILL